MVYKLYCVFSKESLAAMKGVRGKIAAQAGHAYMHSYWDAEARFPEDAAAYRSTESGHDIPQKAYKICLVVDTQEELESLYNYQREKGGCTRVVDAALTVLEEPMLTCIGIGPIDDHQKTEKLKSLKTLT